MRPLSSSCVEHTRRCRDSVSKVTTEVLVGPELHRPPDRGFELQLHLGHADQAGSPALAELDENVDVTSRGAAIAQGRAVQSKSLNAMTGCELCQQHIVRMRPGHNSTAPHHAAAGSSHGEASLGKVSDRIRRR